MLNIKDEIPADFFNVDASGLKDVLDGPTLFHIKGGRQPALFVSVLLHGNEPTGFEAVRAVLPRYAPFGGAKPLPRDISLFVGNVEAAAQGLRRLKGQPDFNRVWPGTEEPASPESRMMADVVEQMKRRGVFVSIDFHNNTGLNPHYACVNSLDHLHLQLATLFSRTVTYFRVPKGVQSLAFSELCPSTTIECGHVSKPGGLDHAAGFLDACIHLSHVPEHAVAEHDLDLFHTVARVTINGGMSFSFDGQAADIMFAPQIDHLNFTELKQGHAIGRTGHGILKPLLAMDEAGRDVTDQYFEVLGEVIYMHRRAMPSMLTMDERAIRQDCF
ncbi:MAG: M14 family metallopeptidase [Sphingomonadales bacterium]